jgi:peptidoglycan/LPS O-acetylase OafA/YrhL
VDRPDSWSILSLLRFFLSAVVVLGHCSYFVGGHSDWTYIGLWLNQGSAVFGFFIVSGLSIGASVGRDPARYLRRRVLRIWPLYLSCIAFGLLVSTRFPNGITWPRGTQMEAPSAQSIIVSLLMLQTILGPPVPIVGQIWSLCPEWWHYMAAPLLKNLSTELLLTCLLGSFAAFMLIPTPHGHGPEAFDRGLGILALSWLWVTGFLYYRLGPTSAGITILFLPSIFACCCGHFTGLPLFISIIAVVFCSRANLPSAAQDILNFLGDLSFPVYLFHMPVMAACLSFGLGQTLPMVVAVLLVSVLALYTIDYPIRHRVWKRSIAVRAA